MERFHTKEYDIAFETTVYIFLEFLTGLGTIFLCKHCSQKIIYRTAD